VVRGPDGAYYVGQLTGFPFPAGGTSVWRLQPGHKPTVYASGFTNVVDIAFDRKGRLLVLEIAKFGLLSNNPTGALIRLDGKNKRTELAPGKLTLPGGVAVGKDNTLYVTNKSVAPGGGEVMHIAAR
jgi:sugar lactone lactonase YvrE